MNPESQEFVELMKKLLSVPAPSAREELIREIIIGHLDHLGYSHETDPAGNLIVRVAGRNAAGPKVVLAAHMDEVGLVVTQVEESGMLRVDRSGRVLPQKVGERPVVILGDYARINGILSFGSGPTSGSGQPGAWSDGRIITGLTRQELAEAGVRAGSPSVPLADGRGPVILGSVSKPLIGAWLLDNRAGVAVQLQLLRKLKEHAVVPPCPTVFSFTIHEEGGCHGAKILAQRERPEIFIALDGCPFIPGCGAAVNGLPTVWSKDALAHYDQRLIRLFSEAARNAGTEIQTAVLAEAYSDASAVYSVGGAPRVGHIGYTRYNSHGFEVAELSVFPNVLNTLFEMAKLDSW